MFTGIVQNLGTVIKKEKRGGQIRFGFRFEKKEKRKPEPGESIAVDGVCLTVAKSGPRTFEADVIRETLEAATLARLKTGSRVNLERSLRIGDPAGGHFVTGHVDGRGMIQKVEKKGRNTRITFQAPKNILPFLAAKGSIAVDGISLTVQAVRGLSFQTGIVPHTLRHTTLGSKKAGDPVNVEADLIARYLDFIPKDHKTSPRPSRSLKIRGLKRQGF